MMSRRYKSGMVLAVAVVLGACEAALGLDATSTISFAVPEEGTPNQMSSGGHVLVVSSATLMLSSVALEGAGQAAQSGHATVRLPVEGGVTTAARVAADAGVYTQVAMVVQSVRVRGTYDGAPFDVTVNGDGSTAQVTLFPPLTVSGNGGANATVRVDVREWFRSDSGGLITPASLSTSASVRATLLSNIGGSLSAFADLDVNGSAG